MFHISLKKIPSLTSNYFNELIKFSSATVKENLSAISCKQSPRHLVSKHQVNTQVVE